MKVLRCGTWIGIQSKKNSSKSSEVEKAALKGAAFFAALFAASRKKFDPHIVPYWTGLLYLLLPSMVSLWYPCYSIAGRSCSNLSNFSIFLDFSGFSLLAGRTKII